jgi:phosphatidylserine/phosphatidylglycerophosphate/cardiolipin synthase-like enzyme
MLKKSGIPIKFYASDWSKEEKLHSKWAVFDETELLVGSANWSKVGLQSNGPKPPGFSSPLQFTRGNHEADVAITSATLCKAFIKQFNFDWLKKTWAVGSLGQLINKVPEPIRGEMLPWTTKKTA